jgi:hypothetical protein
MLKVADNPPVLSPSVSTLADLKGTWWVAHTKSRFEKAFAWDMHHMGIGYFIPLVDRITFSGDRKRHGMLALFTGYVFICGTLEDRLAALRSDRLCQAMEVPNQQQLIDELLPIEKGLLTGAQLDPYPHTAVGKRCRVTRGPFMGTEGVVLNRRRLPRIILEISVLGVGAAMEIDADLLESIDDG